MKRKYNYDQSLRNEDEKFASIATKISMDEKRKLDLILANKDMNYYQWFQLMTEVTLRMLDERNAMTAELSSVIQIFESIPGWKNPVTLLDPNAEPEVEVAIYFLHSKGAHGMKPMMTERGWIDGEWTETENVREIVEKVIRECLPKSYAMLEAEAKRLGKNVIELIMQLADEVSKGNMQDEIMEMFSDNSRSDYGKPTIVYGEKYKTRQHRSPDSDTQSTLNLDN